jgi:hypothetical protein
LSFFKFIKIYFKNLFLSKVAPKLSPFHLSVGGRLWVRLDKIKNAATWSGFRGFIAAFLILRALAFCSACKLAFQVVERLQFFKVSQPVFM